MSTQQVLLYLLITLITFILYKLRSRMNYWKTRGIPHDEPSFPMGNMKGFMRTIHYDDIFKNVYKKHKGSGPFAGFYFFFNPSVLALDLDFIKQVLIKEFAKFPSRGSYYNEKDDPLSAHMVNLDGHKWKTLRHKLSPTFTSGKMKFMFPTILKVAEEFNTVFGETALNNGEVEVKELLARYTTDVIGTIAFGIECNSLRNPKAEFRIMGKKAFSERRHTGAVFGFIQSFPELARKLGFCMTPKDVHIFFMNAVRETIAYREANNVKRNDFMDMLIELKNSGSVKTETGEVISGLTFEELAAQAFVFFTAGFETSSTTLSFALHELAVHQDIQEKLRKEVNDVLKKHNDMFTYEALEEMSYLSQVFLETLRFHTVVPTLIRKCTEDYVVPGYPKYRIPKGMNVLIPAGALHRDPEIYAKPHEFYPEHFAKDQAGTRETAAFLAFGQGARNCIGARFGKLQSRIALALLVKNYRWSLAPKTPIILKADIKSFMMAPDGDITLKVEKV